jgi:hypothetical protein
LFKLSNEEGVWLEIQQSKYFESKTFSQVKAKSKDSSFFKGILRVKEEFFRRGSFVVGSGSNTRLWEDTGLGGMCISQQYPSL